MFGYKPSLEHLKVFGCIAFFYIPKQHRNKLEPRGEIGIMVGYARSRNGYRIYDIKNQKIIEERTVKFHENTMGFYLIDNNDTTNNKKFEVFDFESLFEENDGISNSIRQNENELPENDTDKESDSDSEVIDNEDNNELANINENRKGRPIGTTKDVMQTCL